MKSKLYVGYHLASDTKEKLGNIKNAIEELQSSEKVWFYAFEEIAEERQHSWKYHAGQSMKVSRLPAAFFNKKIPNVETNIKVQGIAGKESIYFLPEKILLLREGKTNHISYENFKFSIDRIEYVEMENNLYQDSTIIGRRWRYINKNGGRDRRFKDNEELPVVRCGLLKATLAEEEKENEVFELMTSSLQAPQKFVSNWEQIHHGQTEQKKLSVTS